ncbi:MAG: Omp28-related outer membrane protein [bacterium]
MKPHHRFRWMLSPWLTIPLLLVCATPLRAAVLLSQNFESGSPPSGWTRTQTVPSVGWEFGTALGSTYFAIGSHTRYAASNDDAHDDSTHNANKADKDRLITPEVDLTPYAGLTVLLTFDYVQPSTYGSTGDVEFTINGGSFWTTITTVTPSTNWTQATVPLSDHTDASTLQIAFRHNDHGGWADGFAIDNVLIQTLARDVELAAITNPSHVVLGSNSILAHVTNRGTTPVTSLAFSYRVNGGGAVNGTVSGLNIPAGQSATITHPIPYNFASYGDYAVTATVTGVNGQSDLNSANDQASATISTASQLARKRVVLEQYTGAWCQFCPDGTVYWNDARAMAREVIGVSVHNADAMDIPDGDTVTNAFAFSFPEGSVDRRLLPDEPSVAFTRGQWLNRIAESLADTSAAKVEITNVGFNAGTRQISGTVSVEFFGDDSGDLRLNLWVLEDGVVGVGNGYDQANFYNTQVGHPFYGAGNPIIGFVHDGVVRAMLGGAWGTAGVIPNGVQHGHTYQQSYQYVLPAGYDYQKIRLVGVLQRYGATATDREIVNAMQTGLFDIFADDFEDGNVNAWSNY